MMWTNGDGGDGDDYHQALREVIPLMELLKEIDGIFPLHLSTPQIKCTVYEDNESYISLANKQKFSPRTKHICWNRDFIPKSTWK